MNLKFTLFLFLLFFINYSFEGGLADNVILREDLCSANNIVYMKFIFKIESRKCFMA